MLGNSSSSPFEFVKESIIQRNKELYKHYTQLKEIKNRKNLYLPKLSLQKYTPRNLLNTKYKNKSIKHNNNLLLLLFEKDNKILNNKINEIYMRQNKKLLNEKIISNLLKQQKHSKEYKRKKELDLLAKTNTEIKNRIKNVHPIINHKELKMQYLESRRLYQLKRQLKPSLSWGNTCFSQEDYTCLEKYKNKLSERNLSLNDTSLSKRINKINKMKFKKLGLSMSFTKMKKKIN